MNYFEFREHFLRLGVVSTNQVYAVEDTFDKNNFGRWVNKGYLIRLKQGSYAFSESLEIPHFGFYIANKIYKPSYISLHSALSFYGMIPETVIQINSVSTLKTSSFKNSVGLFNFQTVKNDLMFGFGLKKINPTFSFLMATPEKAILDLLYLNPYYKTEKDLLELRLDEDFMQNDFNINECKSYLEKIKSVTLSRKANLLFNVFEL